MQDMKLKIVIADDEFIILKGLRSIMEDLKDSVEIVGEARDGEELLNLIEKEHPHAVISDISMPKLTGLEVLNQLSMKNVKPYFVLISGYQEFEYARQAVALSAFDYLLKPIDESALISCISKIKKHIFGEERRDNDFGVASDPEQMFCVLALKAEAAIISGIINILSHENYEAVQYKEYVCVIYTVDRLEDDTSDKIYENAKYVLQMLTERFGTQMWGGLGGVHRSTQNIAHSFCEAEKALQCNYFFDENRVLRHLDKEVFQQPYEIDYQAELDAFLSAIQMLDKQRSLSSFRTLCEYIKYDAEGIKDIAIMKLLKIIEDAKSTLRRTDFDELYDQTVIIQQLKNTSKYSEAVRYTESMLTQFFGSLSNTRKHRESFEIEKIKKYIEEHLSENISLESVAKTIYMNPYYFSVFFKKHIGINFKDYVTKFKMEKAYDLLLKTDKKIYVIARQIGICDQKHFSKMFKKYYGLTPSELRRK